MRAALLILLLWASGLGAAAQFAKVGLILPELAAVYPEAGAAIGWLVSLISVMGMALGLFAGLLAVRIGLKRLLVVSLLLGAVCSFAQALLPPFGWMLASRVVEGASHLGLVVTAPTLIALLAPPGWRGFAMTLWGTFFGVAFALVGWFGIPLAAERGVEALFGAHGAYMAVAAIGVALLLPVPAKTSSEPIAWRSLARRHATVYASPRMAAPAAGWLFYTVTFVALATVLPGTVAPELRTFTATAMPIASIASSMTLGVWLLRFTSAVNVVLLGFGCAAALAAVLAWQPGGAWLPVALFAALGLVQGASFAAVPELNREAGAQALANGGMAQTGNLGNGIGTPLLLALVAGLGFAPAMMAIALILLGGFGVHAALARLRATPPVPAPAAEEGGR